MRERGPQVMGGEGFPTGRAYRQSPFSLPLPVPCPSFLNSRCLTLFHSSDHSRSRGYFTMSSKGKTRASAAGKFQMVDLFHELVLEDQKTYKFFHTYHCSVTTTLTSESTRTRTHPSCCRRGSCPRYDWFQGICECLRSHGYAKTATSTGYTAAPPQKGLVWADLSEQRLDEFYSTADEDEQIR